MTTRFPICPEFNKACSLAEQGNFNSAIALLEDLLQNVDVNKEPILISRCFEALAQCYLEIDKAEDAFIKASYAVSVDPSWSTGHLTLARSARNSGRLCDAIAAFNKALTLTSNEDVEIENELKEAKMLRRSYIADRVGVEDLKINEGFGRDLGPGAVVWECGLYLSSYLSSSRSLDSNGGNFWRNKRVLELGSGTGIVGIVCSLLGCSVMLTDQEQLLSYIKENINLNQSLIQKGRGKCFCSVLDWTSPKDDILVQHWDAIIGADLVYSIHQVEPLVHVLSLLKKSNPNSSMLLSHKTRSESLDQMFFQKLREINIHLKALKETHSNIKIYSV